MLLDLGLVIFFSSPIFITLIICNTVYKIKQLHSEGVQSKMYDNTENQQEED